MAKDKKTLIEFNDLSDAAKQAIADYVLDQLSQTLAPASKDEEAEESEAAEDDNEETDESDEAEADESDDEEESDEAEEDEEEESDDEDEEEEEAPKKKGKKKADDEEEEEESDDEEEAEDSDESEDDEEESDDAEEDEDSDDEEEGDDDPMTVIQGELESIPESLFKQAKTESAAVNAKEAKAEMVEYFTRRDVPAKDAKAMVDGLKEKDLKSCYADYYARFIDTEGEVHDKDDPYKALRIVKGKEVAVWCANGVAMVDGKCVINPKIKAPADKKSAKKITKKGKK